MTDQPSSTSVDPRLHDYLVAELGRAERDFPSLPRPAPRPSGRRLPAGVALAVVAVVVAIVIGPRLLPATSAGPGAPAPAVSTAPSADPAVDCGRLVVAACEQAIALARVGHESELATATRIVADDSCPPSVDCDRLYPFDSIVVFVTVTAGAETTGYSFRVTGLEYSKPTKAEPSRSVLPEHIIERLTPPSSPSPTGG